MEIDELTKFNPWWETGKVREELLEKHKRGLYFEIKKYTGMRQMILIWGLRRTGKTTIMYQRISDILSEGVDPKNVLYFSFDEIAFDMREMLGTYQKIILNKNFGSTKDKIYLFLDEIHKVKDWESKLKTYYDLYPNLKIFISGSASVSLRKRSNESLAGRVFSFRLDPLSFAEFLEILGMDTGKIMENLEIQKSKIVPLFYKYIKYGAFPELANENSDEIARNYIMNNVIDRIIYKDLPEEFNGINDVELLKNLVHLAGKNPGMIVSYKEISKNLGRDQRTISNYFEYLQFGLLISMVSNYRGSQISSMRKLKKVYMTSPSLAFAFGYDFNKSLPLLLENAVMSGTGARFFFRNGFEIDFVIEAEDGITGIEVKRKGKETGQVRKFREVFSEKVKDAFIVDAEKEGEVNGVKIVPIWKLLLEYSMKSRN